MKRIAEMYFYKWAWFLLFLCLTLPPARAQDKPYYFKHLSVEEGLSQSTVLSICQDRQGFMWFGTKDGLNRYDGHSFKVFRHEPGNAKSIGNNVIRALYEDEKDQLWVATDNGVYQYAPQQESFTRFSVATDHQERIEGEVVDIAKDSTGNLWFSAMHQGVFRYSPKANRLVLYQHDPRKPGSFGRHAPNSISMEPEGGVWIGTSGGGVQRFNPATQTFREYRDEAGLLTNDYIFKTFNQDQALLIGTKNGGLKKLDKKTGLIADLFTHDEEKQSLFIRTIGRYSGNELWLGTESGLYIYRTQDGQLQHLTQNPDDPYSLSDNAIYSIYKDREGGMWVGTYFGGVNYFPHQPTPFEKYYPLHNTNSLSGKRVREFCEDAQGNLWIGTEDEGLNQFNPRTRTFKQYKPNGQANSISYHNIHGLLVDGDRLWVGTYSHGLDVIHLKTGAIKHYEKSGEPNSLGDNDIYSIYKDKSGNIWIGTVEGAYQYHRETDHFTAVPAIGSPFIYDILEYGDKIWFATHNEGLIQYDPATGRVRKFRQGEANQPGLPHNTVLTLFEDSRHRLWLGTEGGGLCRYDVQRDRFTVYSTRQGLPSNTVYKILEDDHQNLWLSTMNGLVKFSPDAEAARVFTKANGLLVNQFNYKSGIKCKDGTLYFGSLNGFVGFDPEAFSENTYVPPVVLTGFQVFNQDVPVGDNGLALQKSIAYTDAITLPHDQSSLSFTFAALSFTASQAIKYAYQMEGLDQNWTHLEQNQKVSYSRLSPGDYVFRVKATNGNGAWNEKGAHLRIRILPPFWQSSLALGGYALLLLLAGYWGVRSYKKRVEKRHQQNLEKLKSEKEKEIYNAKIEFFTHIAHEIRTPLTLIKGPLEYLLQNEIPYREIKESLSVMDRNTNRLIVLTNQLLDFRKIDREGLNLNFVKTDVTILLQEIYIRFKPAAQQRGIYFLLDLPEGPFFADVDQEALNKLFSNLFSNAIKHACTRIELQTETVAAEGTFTIRVSNDGDIIPVALKEKIFEPFFQVDISTGRADKKGTGLGLPLARSLAQLHRGQLYLEDYTAGMNTFVVTLPIRQENAIDLSAVPENAGSVLNGETSTKADQKATHQPSLLVVEDNKELQKFLVDQLKPRYRVHKASHGVEALAILDQEPVDIVISDVMMPLMSGFELCKTIKSVVDYSHIPVVLLTAKNNLDSRLAGLEMGADAYLEKPFSVQHLLLQITTLMSNREKMRKSFAQSPTLMPQSMALTRADEQFLSKVTDIIHQHLSDVDFGVDQLADALHVSQSTLLRKIKAVSDLSPLDFIRLVRLKKAAQLIEEGEYRIKEICWMVGFNSASYFAKCFQKQFGVLPKDFVKR